MCDEHTVKDNERYLRGPVVSRRGFGALAGGAALMAVLPRPAFAVDVVESDVTIETPDGMCDAYFVHPAAGAAPAVLVWPDIMGLRPAFRAMGKRLAESGYSVLVVNPFYRSAPSPVVAEGETFQDPPVRERLFGLMGALTPETNVTDATAFVSWLDQQEAVDTSRKIGTTGYCMGGPITMRTAAALPNRIGAAGSFHGGGLATDDPNSPHLLVPEMQASYLIAIAENDDMNDPEAKTKLREAFDAAGLMAEIEVYEGAQHGWTVPDSNVYNEEQAERAWARLLAMFETALA
jgi:carboxymethylenebutenolidase